VIISRLIFSNPAFLAFKIAFFPVLGLCPLSRNFRDEESKD